MNSKQSVVVTGASTGIGWGTAKVLIANGFHVFGSVRKTQDADRLRKEFGREFSPLLMDVTDEAAVRQASAQVEADLGRERLAGLVNNAGIAVPGPLLQLPLPDYRHQLEVNLLGPLLVTQAFAQLLGADPGREGSQAESLISVLSAGRSVCHSSERMLPQSTLWKECRKLYVGN